MRSGWKQLQNTWRLHERLMYLFVERSIQTVVVRSARYSATINSKSSQVNFPFRTLIKHTDELKDLQYLPMDQWKMQCTTNSAGNLTQPRQLRVKTLTTSAMTAAIFPPMISAHSSNKL